MFLHAADYAWLLAFVSAGMRVGELLNLKIEDIDSDRMLKGMDRMTVCSIFSEKMLALLPVYINLLWIRSD